MIQKFKKVEDRLKGKYAQKKKKTKKGKIFVAMRTERIYNGSRLGID